MSHIRLFDHPFRRAAFDGMPALAITGVLPDAKPSLAYEGRLSIVNLGQASAEVISVTGALPPGATVQVDNANDQVVVAWPAYQASAAPIPNPAFELGDRDWLKGAGWSIAADAAQPGFGAVCALWNGHGEAVIESVRFAAVAAGQSITASCAVAQGASSQGNCGAAVQLRWYDASYGPLPASEGNMVASSNPSPQTSSVTASAPANGFVRIAARGYRKRQNKVLRVDNFAWNATQPSVGTNVEGTIGPITIRIRDTLGREAEWTGSILVSINLQIAVVGSSGIAGQTSVAFSIGATAWAVVPSTELTALNTGRMAKTSSRWVIAAFSGAEHSADTETWTPSGGGSMPVNDLASDGGSVVVGVGNTGFVCRSTDGGENFATSTFAASGNAQCIEHGGGLWVIGVAGTAQGPYRYSASGEAPWTQGPEIMPYEVRTAKYAGAWYFGGGQVDRNNAGKIVRSVNGTSGHVTLQDTPASVGEMATDGLGNWVAVLGNNQIIYSDDDWATYQVSAVTFASAGTEQNGLVYDGEQFVMAAVGGVRVSPNGGAWSAAINPGVDGAVASVFSAFRP